MPSEYVRPRASRTRHAADMPRGPYNVWLVAGTTGSETYPCLCMGDRPCGRRCGCRGRGDVETMPALCCGRREAEQRMEQE